MKLKIKKLFFTMFLCFLFVPMFQNANAMANNKDIAQSLQLKSNQIFLVNKYKAQAKGFKTSELRKIIQELEDLDYNYKIGLIDLNVGLESILCVYCS